MSFYPGEVTNLPIILKECQSQGLTLPYFKEDIAYILATARHETASWQTLEEYRNLNGSIPTYWNNYGGGAKYHGRGYVQLTHDWNYRKFSNILNKDLVTNPDLALDPETAAFILVYGMKNGSFTGKKLQDFAYNYCEGEPEVIDKIAKIGDRAINFIPARQIVNGNDRAMLINNYARDYVIRINNGEFDKYFDGFIENLSPISEPNSQEVPKPTIIEFPKTIREPKRKLENIDYQNAWGKKDITWFVNSLIDRDGEVQKLKNENLAKINQNQDLENTVLSYRETIGIFEKEIIKLNNQILNNKTEFAKKIKELETKLTQNPQKEIPQENSALKNLSQNLENLKSDKVFKDNQNYSEIEKEKFDFNKFWVGMSKNATIQSILGVIITSGISWITTKIPELQPFQSQITLGLLSFLGIGVVGQNTSNIIKLILKNSK